MCYDDYIVGTYIKVYSTMTNRQRNSVDLAENISQYAPIV